MSDGTSFLRFWALLAFAFGVKVYLSDRARKRRYQNMPDKHGAMVWLSEMDKLNGRG